MNETLMSPPPPASDSMPFAPPEPPSKPSSKSPEFVRPRVGRRIGGVCAAVADRYGWRRTTVRLVAALSILLPGPQVLAYLIAWFVMPSDDEAVLPV